jgi:hypothetical protein
MGAVLNQLANLPVDENVHFYIFVINGQYREPLYEMVQRNFFEIAESIGDHAVIAVGTNQQKFTTSVAQHYLGKDNSDPDFVRVLPALLITNDHPDQLNKDSLRLIVPLREAESRFEDWHQFFRALTAFVRGENDEFVRRFEAKESLVEAANAVVNLRPGMFGIGININELVARWQKSREARQSARR